jgi:hypothetical protein
VRRASIVAVALTILALGTLVATRVQAQGVEFAPFDAPAGGGIVIGIWNGGGADELAAAAAARGCPLTSAWVSAGGSLVGYLPGAPAFANQAFLAAFAGGEIPGGTVMVLLCRARSPGTVATPPPAPTPRSAPTPASTPAAFVPSSTPNFLVIMTDNQPVGSEREFMPETWARIYEQGVQFSNSSPPPHSAVPAAPASSPAGTRTTTG